MAEKVAGSMSVKLTGEDKKRLSHPSTDNFKAYELYLQGRFFWNKRTDEGLRRSIEYFQRATTEDRNYALAYAGLADAYALLSSYGMEPASQAYPKAKEAALKALQLDDSLAEAYTSLGLISFFYEWKWQDAETQFRRAIASNGNYAMAHNWYALELAALGRFQEALDEIHRAEKLDPLSLIIRTDVGRISYFSRRYDDAIDACRRALEMDPRFARAHTRLGMVYAAKGEHAAAIAELHKALELSGPDAYLDGLLGYSLARVGQGASARKLLERLRHPSPNQYVPPFSVALVYLGLGERDHAIDWLEKAFDDRSTLMAYAYTDPLLDPVRSDARFRHLVQRIGLF